MQQTEFKYPVFEANQVLTNAHLNDIFEYLDEQGRLTRANLIGIGLVCGLEFTVDTVSAAIHLSRGCGITSQGYLIIEPEDVALTAYREYVMPLDVDYPSFKQAPAVQYPLWELFPADTPSTTSLGSPANFLEDKALLLFLELKKEGLRNCSPNDCNDKGSEINATVRRLLIRISDLEQIISKANDLNTGATAADIESVLMARLNLPDIRLPRYDVPNTGPVTSNQVYAAFLEVFRRNNLTSRTGNALTAAYHAFLPIVENLYPVNPFDGFSAAFGFLDTAPQNAGQVRFLQYYYDLFDDLLKAYDELRDKGIELMCACCPSEDLFPRHLMLGALFPAVSVNPGIYRHHFLASAAVGDCENRTLEVVQLFRRLVEMTIRFSNTPSMPPQSGNPKLDSQIRLTPSKLGDFPLSEKAIPYYYQQNGTPALYQLWNAEKSRRHRANQNLSYRSYEYVPAAPIFVTEPLRYDLEPNNFLRVEGHLGKGYRSVMDTLLHIKKEERLPIEIIALRTGEYDENMSENFSQAECRFQDLEAIYDVEKAELLCTFCKTLEYFYNLPYSAYEPSFTPFPTTVPLLAVCAPGYRVQPRTMGAYFERLSWPSVRNSPYFPPTQEPGSLISQISASAPVASNFLFLYIIYYLAKFMEVVRDNLQDFDLTSFETRVRDIAVIAELIERNKEAYMQQIGVEGNIPNWEETDDRLDALSKACHLDAFQALHTEYTRRLREIRQKQFLNHFLQHHPGIQHKAGVPLGGTFIVVYHDPPVRTGGDIRGTIANALVYETLQSSATNAGGIRGRITDAATGEPLIGATVLLLGTTQGTVTDVEGNFLFNNLAPGIYTIEINYIGYVSRRYSNIQVNPGQIAVINSAMGPEGAFIDEVLGPDVSPLSDRVITAVVNELPRGAVIADFFLPYICCSDCAPIQFVLPAEVQEMLETCEYRWPSRHSFLIGLGKNYTFTITRYRINGIDVIATTPHPITILAHEIKARGLAAVVDALNGLRGLVFGLGSSYADHTTPTYSYITIQRYRNHTFELVIQEEREDDVFTYTEDGVQLNDGSKIYTYGAKINCRQAPVNEEPTPPALPCGGVIQTCRYRWEQIPIKIFSVVSLVVSTETQPEIEIPVAAGVNHRFNYSEDTVLSNSANLVIEEFVNALNQIFTSSALAPYQITFQYEADDLIAISRYICLDFALTVDSDGQIRVFTKEGLFIVNGNERTRISEATGCTPNENN